MARNSPVFSLSQVVLPWLLSLSSLYYPINNGPHEPTMRMKKFEGMFLFGTSVVDSGNNNYLNFKAKVNYLPYGIDFPLGPTGRFSNGRNLGDSIAELLGLPLVLPFLDPKAHGQNIIRGVNFGSGGCRIIDETTGGAMSMNEQINYFKEVTMPELREQTNGMHIELDQYLFLMAAGNDDVGDKVFNLTNTSKPNITDYFEDIISNYAYQLQRLYNVGARKFALVTAYPLGCSPMVLLIYDSKQCLSVVNSAVQFFNTKLIAMVDDLIQKLPGSKFVVINTFNIIADIIKDPIAKGFTNASSPCCELKGTIGSDVSCKEGGKLCYDRNKYVYFDGHHNTEVVNDAIAAKALFSNSSNEVYPFNLQRLAFL